MTYNSAIITLFWEFHAWLRGSLTVLCQDNRFILEPVWRLLRLARTEWEETALDAVEFIEFTWTETGCYHKSKDGCAWTFGTGSWGLWLPTDTRQQGCSDRLRLPWESLTTLVICWWLLSRWYRLTWRSHRWWLTNLVRYTNMDFFFVFLVPVPDCITKLGIFGGVDSWDRADEILCTRSPSVPSTLFGKVQPKDKHLSLTSQ